MLNQSTRFNRILLADDDEDDRILFRDALREVHSGFDLTEVENGADLMEYLNKSNHPLPDVLFLDLNMPLKNGYECLSEIRAKNEFRSLPIVILSTSSLDEQLRLLLRIHACSYIKKPGSYPELKTAIRRSLVSTSKDSVIYE